MNKLGLLMILTFLSGESVYSSLKNYKKHENDEEVTYLDYNEWEEKIKKQKHDQDNELHKTNNTILSIRVDCFSQNSCSDKSKDSSVVEYDNPFVASPHVVEDDRFKLGYRQPSPTFSQELLGYAKNNDIDCNSTSLLSPNNFILLSPVAGESDSSVKIKLPTKKTASASKGIKKDLVCITCGCRCASKKKRKLVLE